MNKLIWFLLIALIVVRAHATDERRARVRTGGYITLAHGDPCWRYWTPHGYIEDCPYYRDYAYYYRPDTYFANWWVGHNIGRPYYGGYRRKHRTHYHHVHHNRARRSSPPAQHGNSRISQSHVGAGYGVQGMIGTH